MITLSLVFFSYIYRCRPLLWPNDFSHTQRAGHFICWSGENTSQRSQVTKTCDKECDHLAMVVVEGGDIFAKPENSGAGKSL